MVNIIEKDTCCGCTACYSICPQNAISMEADAEGFKYPKIEEEKCVKCNLCETVCPIKNNPSVKVNFERQGIIARTNEESVLNKCSSGGMFFPIAKWIIDKGGYVCGATYDKNFQVIHNLVNNKNELINYMGSKYVQSNLNNCFTTIKKLLETGGTVAFFGTTCQVYGLKKFLQKEYENLYTIDLVCHGTPSPKLLEKYLNYHQNKQKCKVTNINFRSKKYGYHVASLTIDFENGKQYCASARTDYLLRAFFSEIASRPSCYNCHFKIVERCSDLTVYDAWHAHELVDTIKDDDKGFTHVIIQSEKGSELFKALSDEISFWKVDLKKAIYLDGPMIENSAIMHENRNIFYKDIDNYGLEKSIAKNIPISHIDKCIELFKKCVYKSGILNSIRTLLRE